MDTSSTNNFFWRLEHLPEDIFSQSLISILDPSAIKEIRLNLFNTQNHLTEFPQDLNLPWRIYKTLLVNTCEDYIEFGLEEELNYENTQYILLLWSNNEGIKIRFDLFKFYWRDLIYPSDENIVIWMPSARIFATVIEEQVSLWKPNPDNRVSREFSGERSSTQSATRRGFQKS